jgi:hypothetical protein
MLVALTLLFSPLQSVTCAPYVEGQRELTLGAKHFAGKRYYSAYRHYSRGLKVIDRLNGESAAQLPGLKDDSMFAESNAKFAARARRYREAAEDLSSVLIGRLDTINTVHHCG